MARSIVGPEASCTQTNATTSTIGVNAVASRRVCAEAARSARNPDTPPTRRSGRPSTPRAIREIRGPSRATAITRDIAAPEAAAPAA